MPNLTIQSYRLVLTDLLEQRTEPLRRLSSAPRYEEEARRLVDEMDALFSTKPAKAPGTAAALARHVEATGVLSDLLNAAERHPLYTPAQREAAADLWAVVLDGRTVKARSAGSRAGDAVVVRKLRPQLEAALALFPAAPGQPSLADLLDHWMAVGDELGRLVSGKSVGGATGRTPAAIVHDANGLVGRIRRAVRLALQDDPALPRDLEAQVLGYCDALKRPKQRAVPPEAAPPAAPPEAAPPAAPSLPPA